MYAAAAFAGVCKSDRVVLTFNQVAAPIFRVRRVTASSGELGRANEPVLEAEHQSLKPVQQGIAQLLHEGVVQFSGFLLRLQACLLPRHAPK